MTIPCMECDDRINCQLNRVCKNTQSTDTADLLKNFVEKLRESPVALTPRIPQLIELLDKVKQIHIKKNQDYALESNPYSNFEFAASISEEFKDPVDKVFVTLIGVKLARLTVLLGREEGPLNESIDDSFLDLTTYTALWASYRSYRHGL